MKDFGRAGVVAERRLLDLACELGPVLSAGGVGTDRALGDLAFLGHFHDLLDFQACGLRPLGRIEVKQRNH